MYDRLGFDAVADEAFKQLVLARIIEPTSKADSLRVLDEVGVEHASLRTMFRSLARAQERGYRDTLAAACFAHASTRWGSVAVPVRRDHVVLRGRERGRAAQGWLLQGTPGRPAGRGRAAGGPGRVPVGGRLLRGQQGRDRHAAADRARVPGSAQHRGHGRRRRRRDALGDATSRSSTRPGCGSSSAPGSPRPRSTSRRTSAGTATRSPTGSQVDTITPRHGGRRTENDPNLKAEPAWDPAEHPGSWRAVWAYSAKRAARDAKTLTLQENRAKAVVAGEKAARTPRFVTDQQRGHDPGREVPGQGPSLVGLKGYVTNIPVDVMPAGEVIASYHDLWRVEQSFRMSKTDLRARPMFHHTRDAIEAHLTVVFAALAVARYLQDATGMSVKKIVRALRPLQQITVQIAGHDHLAQDPLTDTARIHPQRPRHPGSVTHPGGTSRVRR